MYGLWALNRYLITTATATVMISLLDYGKLMRRRVGTQ